MRKTSYEYFGIECGKGWAKCYEPLIALCNRLGIEILQVKEKFGLLRFYYGSVDVAIEPAIRAAVDLMEERSGRVCESCGRENKLQYDKEYNCTGYGGPVCRYTNGWIRTLCIWCNDEYEGNNSPMV